MITSEQKGAGVILTLGLLITTAPAMRAGDWSEFPSFGLEETAPRAFDLVEVSNHNVLPCIRGSVAKRFECLNLEVLRQARELHSLGRKLDQTQKPQVIPVSSGS